MTLKKAKELLAIQAWVGGGYHRNDTKLILADLQGEHERSAVDQLITTLQLETIFGFKTGTEF